MDDCETNGSNVNVVLDEEICCRRSDVDTVLQQLMHAIRTLPCAQDSLTQIELALAEALANAIIHGNREDPDKRVHVWAACFHGEQFVVAVTDQGKGFDISRVPDPTDGENVYATHGRGIYLMNQLMDSAEHRLGGRQVVMRKRARRPEDPPEAAE